MGIVHVACVAAARKCVSAVEVIRGTPAGRARVTDDAANCKNNSRRDAVISQASPSQLRHEHHGPGYATPQLAREQPPEQFAYVAALHEGTGIDRPDSIASATACAWSTAGVASSSGVRSVIPRTPRASSRSSHSGHRSVSSPAPDA